MPPKAVKTIKDLIYWQYAKLISEPAGFGKKNYRFIMSRFTKLKSGEINWSSSIREWIRENEMRDICGYCGSKDKNLTVEHILPSSRGGPDHPDNTIWVCKDCNLKKSKKRLYEYFTLKNRDNIPRIAEGKYLKLIYDLHEKNDCDMKKNCIKFDSVDKLSIYCLEGIFK